MIFSREDLEKLQLELQTIPEKYEKLLLRYVQRGYNNPQAKEFATHGFLRRLKTLVRCVENVFRLLPPNRIELPTEDELADAAINIQAFVFNVFACTDNLAWMWVLERGLANDDGLPIPKERIGLSKKKKRVRRSFSLETQKYLMGLNGWFDYLENFRHALAHRIPLYIPPYVVPRDKLAAYQNLEDRIVRAIEHHDFAMHDRLFAEQRELGAFHPYVTHSFEENSNIIVFHAQLLKDFDTIDELGQRILEELDR